MSINLTEVGAAVTWLSATSWKVQIGVYLPGIKAVDGYKLIVRVIHEDDQFTPGKPPTSIDLQYVGGTQDLWQTTTTISTTAGTNYGKPGRYLYRYVLLHNGHTVLTPIPDPFAREAGPGTYSAFTLKTTTVSFTWHDAGFQVPAIDDMVVYELHVGEFARNFRGVIKMLDYLTGLGVNVLELMPFTNVRESAEWGYTPLGFYCPDDRYGTPDDLKQLVDESHQKGLAVILDAVYAHAHPDFAYESVYTATGKPSPMMGVFSGEFFQGRPGTDFNKAFTRDFFLELNKYWINEFHLDGFRYDYVPGMLDGPTGNGYAAITYHTYQLSKNVPRFQDPAGHSRIIQCAEHLPDPKGILQTTYSNCAWQNMLMDKCADAAIWKYVDANLAFMFDPEFIGYPSTYNNPSTNDSFPVAPFQYLEQHDNERFIARIAKSGMRDLINEPYGDRSAFYRVQPFLIALYMGKGIPMLWQGQEICDNWGMASWGIGRNLFERPVHWEFLYDTYGQALLRLCRLLGTLRQSNQALKARGDFYYFNDHNHHSQGVLAFRRSATSAKTFMVLINFSETPQTVWVPFPSGGTWNEQIDQDPAHAIYVNTSGEWHGVPVPSFYGRIFSM
ncbi:MAG: alpha-amylase [Planctomycetes bacterium]|nr:alpha-amylase [Planctomycetota bacterium]